MPRVVRLRGGEREAVGDLEIELIIDLHIHTNLGSICSQLGPDELLERAQQMGIDAVCVTEHHSHRGANKMVEYAAAI